MSEGVKRIAAERQRQIEKKGWTAEHDDSHEEGSLAMTAACYAAYEPIFAKRITGSRIEFFDPWPWSGCDDKRPRNRSGYLMPVEEQPTGVRIRALEKAGALIAAEIDRLLRLEAK